MLSDDIETRANDIISALTQQRDQALNAVVQLQATLAAKQREIDALKSALTSQPGAPPAEAAA